MDDLLGLDLNFSSTSNNKITTNSQSLKNNTTSRPSPTIAAFRQPSALLTPPATSSRSSPADSFANLLGGIADKNRNHQSLSLREQQRQKQAHVEKGNADLDAVFGPGLAPPPTTLSSQSASPLSQVKTNEILDALTSTAPVSWETRFPPPNPSPSNEDILGLLARPVEEFEKPPSPSPPASASSNHKQPQSRPNDENPDPRDRAVAELVGMGFEPNQAAIALARTESGFDLRDAIGFLLQDAHNESHRKSLAKNRSLPTPPSEPNRSRANPESHPAWMSSLSTSRSVSKSQIPPEKDVTQLASEIGNNLFKSANALWKTGQKRVQKVVAELQQPQTSSSSSSQPKWMRDALADAQGLPRTNIRITDEARALEASHDISKPVKKQSSSSALPPRRQQSPSAVGGQERHTPSPLSSLSIRPSSRLTRQEVEDYDKGAYQSPARRRPPPPSSSPQPQTLAAKPATHARQKSPLSASSIDKESELPVSPSAQAPSFPPRKSNNTTPIPIKPTAAKPKPPPPRKIPFVSDSALSSSATKRQAGSDAFKLGDYAKALECYSASLLGLPSSHPITIVILCNRALANIKCGNAKAAIVDADAALQVVGAANGMGEQISVLDSGSKQTTTMKDMREFYGKALMRKAEALELLEKWSEAADIWRLASEAGAGGTRSIQARVRCEQASGRGGSPSMGAKRLPTVKAKPAIIVVASKTAKSATPASTVETRRRADAAAEQLETQKFELQGSVDAKIKSWSSSNEQNVRALLASMDKVLWPGSGWNKVGIHELLMPNKVKVAYFRAVSTIHPDKIGNQCTVEQRMISESVFSIVNKAWDVFREENGL